MPRLTSLASRAQAVQLGALTLSAALAWATFYLPGGSDLLYRVSFRPDDPSWVPPDYVANPIMGVHYFGDFELYRAWAQQANPYDLELSAAYLPVAHLIWSPIAALPERVGLALYLVASTLVLGAGFAAISRGGWRESKSNFITLFLLFGILTVPTLVDFDRGNLQTLVLGATAIFVGKGLQQRALPALPWLLAAAAFKPYLLIMSIAFVDRRSWRATMSIVFGYLAANLALLAWINGGAVIGVMRWYEAFSKYGTSEGIPYMMHSGSLVGAISRWLEFGYGSEFAYDFLERHLLLLQIISLGMLVLGLAVWFQKTLPTWARLLGLFSIVTVAQAGSAQYQWVWVGFVMIAFLYEAGDGVGHTIRLDNRFWVLQTLAVLALIPMWYAPVFPSGASRGMPAFLVLTPLVVIVLIYLLAKGRRAPHNIASVLRV